MAINKKPATLKKDSIRINKNWGEKPQNIIIEGMRWETDLKAGETYDLVQFAINEIVGYYWRTTLGIRQGHTKKDIEDTVNEVVSQITEKDVKEYKDFLDDGKKYGWN